MLGKNRIHVCMGEITEYNPRTYRIVNSLRVLYSHRVNTVLYRVIHHAIP